MSGGAENVLVGANCHKIGINSDFIWSINRSFPPFLDIFYMGMKVNALHKILLMQSKLTYYLKTYFGKTPIQWMLFVGLFLASLAMIKAPHFLRPVWLSFGLLAGWYGLKAETAQLRSAIAGLFLGSVLAVLFIFGRQLIADVLSPQQWDFYAFYVHGHGLANGVNIYSPEALTSFFESSVKLPNPITESFREQVLNVGCHYPPPTLLYFLPAGFFSFEVGNIVWLSILLTALGTALFLAQQTFFPNSHRFTWLFVFVLAMAFPPIQRTLMSEQTNFLMLLWTILAYRHRHTPWIGLWLALAVFTKPVMAMVGIYVLLKRNWGGILVGIGSVIALLGVSYLVIGHEIFMTYFTDNPVARVPAYQYSEAANQSLAGFLIRNTGLLPYGENPMNNSLYLSILGALSLMTAWVVFQLKEAKEHWGFWLCVSLALLAYPGTLHNYSTLLILPIFAFVSTVNMNDRRLFFIGMAVILLAISFMMKLAFLSNLLFWLGLMIWGSSMILAERGTSLHGRYQVVDK